MTLAELIVKITGDSSELKKELAAAVAASKAADGETGTAAKGISGKWKMAAMASGVALGALATGAVKAVGDASDLNEAINKASVTFGSAAKTVPGYSSSVASSLGMSRAAALDNAAGLAAMVQAMGATKGESATMSTQMLKTAADMASFHNADPTDMLDRLRAGLSGESEPLKKYGVLVSDARVKQEAARLGLVAHNGTLTDAQKLQARYSLILKDSAVSNNDFANTSGGLANQQRILKAEITDLSAQLGTALLPAAQATVSIFAALVGWMSQHTTVVQVLIGVIGGLAAGILVVAAATKAWAIITGILNMVMAANPFVLVAALIAGLVVAFITAYRSSETFRNIVQAVFSTVTNVVTTFANFFTVTLPNAFSRVLSWLRGNWPIIAMIVSGPFAPLVALATDAFGVRSALTGAFSAIVTMVRDKIGDAVGAVRAVTGAARGAGDAVGSAISNGITSGLSALSSLGGHIIGKVSSAISSAAGAASGAASAIGSAITSGILSGLGGLFGALKSKLESTLSSALSSVNPFSPVEHGGELYIGQPLVAGAVKGLAGMEKALMRELSSGIRGGVTAASSSLPSSDLTSSGLPSSRAAAGGPPIVIQVSGNTLLSESYETAERLARILLPALDRVTAR